MSNSPFYDQPTYLFKTTLSLQNQNGGNITFTGLFLPAKDLEQLTTDPKKFNQDLNFRGIEIEKFINNSDIINRFKSFLTVTSFEQVITEIRSYLINQIDPITQNLRNNTPEKQRLNTNGLEREQLENNQNIQPEDLFNTNIYRLKNIDNNAFLFTGFDEAKNILSQGIYTQFYRENVDDQGVGNNLAFKTIGLNKEIDDSLVNTEVFYRYNNTNNGTYLYVGEEEKNDIDRQQKQQGIFLNLRLEGEAFLALSPDTPLNSGIDNLSTVFRFQDIINNSYLFVGEAEKNDILNQGGYGGRFVLEGAAFNAVF